MENKVFKARKKFGQFKTFGEYLKEGMDKKGISISSLEDRFAQRNELHTEKEIKYWTKDMQYPDITVIYLLAEWLEIHPNDLLEAKQNMQEAGLNAVDMLMMRVICNFIDVSIWKLHIFNNIMFWLLLIAAVGVAWGINVPILGPIVAPLFKIFM